MSLDFIFILISGLFVAAASGLVGSILVLKRMTLLSDALSHIALPGIAIGIVLKFEPLLGGIIFLFIGSILIWYIETKTRLATESITAVLFVTALAIGSLIIPKEELLETFLGNFQNITNGEAIAQTLIAIFIIALGYKYMKRLTLFAIAPELSAASRVHQGKTQLILLTLVALTIAIGISFVGILLMSALSIIPAVTARNIATNLKSFIGLSMSIAVISLASGIFIAEFFSLPIGATTVIISAIFFTISLFKKH